MLILYLQFSVKISDIDFIELGYAYPPSDGWYTNQDNGGSDHYDVYLFNLSAGYYGYVMGENYAQADDIFNRGDNEHTSLTTETNALTSLWLSEMIIMTFLAM